MNEEPFDHVEVNDYGIHRTISVAVVNVGDGRLTNCIIRRKYTSFGEPRNVPIFLDGGFTLFPGDKRYVAIAMFNEHRNPQTSNLIGLCAPCVGGYFDAHMIAVPRLPIGSYNLTLEATSPDSRTCEIHCHLWVDETNRLRLSNLNAPSSLSGADANASKKAAVPPESVPELIPDLNAADGFKTILARSMWAQTLIDNDALSDPAMFESHLDPQEKTAQRLTTRLDREIHD